MNQVIEMNHTAKKDCEYRGNGNAYIMTYTHKYDSIRKCRYTISYSPCIRVYIFSGYIVYINVTGYSCMFVYGILVYAVYVNTSVFALDSCIRYSRLYSIHIRSDIRIGNLYTVFRFIEYIYTMNN